MAQITFNKLRVKGETYLDDSAVSKYEAEFSKGGKNLSNPMGVIQTVGGFALPGYMQYLQGTPTKSGKIRTPSWSLPGSKGILHGHLNKKKGAGRAVLMWWYEKDGADAVVYEAPMSHPADYNKTVKAIQNMPESKDRVKKDPGPANLNGLKKPKHGLAPGTVVGANTAKNAAKSAKKKSAPQPKGSVQNPATQPKKEKPTMKAIDVPAVDKYYLNMISVPTTSQGKLQDPKNEGKVKHIDTQLVALYKKAEGKLTHHNNQIKSAHARLVKVGKTGDPAKFGFESARMTDIRKQGAEDLKLIQNKFNDLLAQRKELIFAKPKTPVDDTKKPEATTVGKSSLKKNDYVKPDMAPLPSKEPKASLVSKAASFIGKLAKFGKK